MLAAIGGESAGCRKGMSFQHFFAKQSALAVLGGGGEYRLK